MAAAIKMDELLVSWLGSDSMYEHVLNLIEENKLATQKQQQQQQKAAEEQQLKQEEEETNAMQSTDNKEPSEEDSSSTGDNNTAASPRCVIPKFYLADSSRPRRRRRLLPMPQSETWDPLPEDERDDNSNSKPLNQYITDNHDTIPVAGDNGHNNCIPAMCVRDQIGAVWDEIGQGPGDDISQKFITVQDFVRVTKDIFRFPTFFNVPLCQRLLLLWREYNGLEKEKDLQQHQQPMLMEEPSPDEPITYEMVEWYWKQEMEPFDYQERFFRLCKQLHAEYIVRDDFLPFIKALLNDHPVRKYSQSFVAVSRIKLQLLYSLDYYALLAGTGVFKQPR